MIKRTRRSLLLVFSSILALILIILAASFYFMLAGVVNRDEHNRMEKTGKKTADEWVRHTTGKGYGFKDEFDRLRIGVMEWEFLQYDQFAVVFDTAGNMISSSSDDRNPLIDAEIQERLVGRMSGSDYFRLEKTVPEGRSVYALYRISPGDGKGSVIFIGEDISNQIHLLREMKWLIAGLSGVLLLVASGTGYVFAGRAMVPIMRSLKRQQEFTADASHELRTPLSVLQSSVEILEEEQSRLPAVHRTVLHHMKDELIRMIRLTEQLLTLARSDSGGTPLLRNETFDLRDTLQAVTTRMQTTIAKEKGIDISLDDMLPEEDISYAGDRDQISQVLYILLDNAVKYSFPNGTVMIQARRNNGGGVELTVTDQGCGIPEENLPYLFERFFRVDKARSREWGGTGLGLSIAAQIIRHHGGRIEVKSTINRGSTFTVRLP